MIGSGFGFIQKSRTQEAQQLVSLMKSWDYAYGFMDAYSYGSVAAGRLDVCVNLCDKPWDCAAAACIVTEAGGRFSDIHGAASVYNGSVVLSNGFVHDAVLEYFHMSFYTCVYAINRRILGKTIERKTGRREKEAPRRSEKAGIFHFTKDMVSALAMALIAIVYVIQAFKIPTGSMENSLLVGDFLLGLKFIYGAPVFPFCYTKFPGITDPKPGDVIIFKYPGADKKDYIKRCVAGPGQTIQVEGTTVTVDGKVLVLPPKGQYIHGGELDPRITHFEPLRVPKKGDTLFRRQNAGAVNSCFTSTWSSRKTRAREQT